MFVDFFIKRPVFAIVCSLIIVLVGAICIPILPTEQYPDISPVQIVVSANSIGASAEVVEETVTSILERQINGVEGMRYITSTSSNDGTSTITVTFEQGYNKDIAAVDVQNRVSIVEPQLPEAVRQTGVTVSKQSSIAVLGTAIYSKEDKYTDTFISNYLDLYVLDSIKRINGVGSVVPFGERRYAMRLWVDPSQLARYSLTAQDVVDALNRQNLQVGVGRIGQAPAPDGQMYQVELQAQGRLEKPEEFGNLVLKKGENGTLVKLKDVGRAELGAESYSSFGRWQGHTAVGFEVRQLPGSNALNTANAVKAELQRLSKNFPPGLTYDSAYDPTLFVVESRKEVIKTLYEAIVLVIVVIFVFIQDWRATLIPVITIPVSLIGTFAFIKAFGFSINGLTLFGLTLATGLVVDDAIIVVEDVSRLIEEEKVSPRKAASKAMRELFAAVIATSLVLMAVFVPVAFFPGTTGQLYKQFALTIAFSIALSTFNALTLTPALSALLLRQGQKPRGWIEKFFGVINWFLNLLRRGYRRSLDVLVHFKAIVVGLLIVSIGITAWLYQHVPTAFVPEEDQGMFINIVQGPDGTALEYTDTVVREVEQSIIKLPEVRGVFSLIGVGFNGNLANNAMVYAPLKPWEEREEADQAVNALIQKVNKPFSEISEATVSSVNLPTIPGLGSFGGFQFELQDRGNNDIATSVKVRDEILARAKKAPELKGIFSNYAASMPQLQIDLDRDKTEALGVSVDEALRTLQIFLGSRYVNDFNAFGRTYRVYIQADEQFRSNPEAINKLYVRSTQGQMIPLGNLVSITPSTGPQTINHYNLYRSIEINGAAAPGFSSGQAIQAMERIASEVLPNNMGFEWTGIALEELASGSQALFIFGLGLLLVFLVLAAQYENFIDPVTILLSVPLAILGALLAQSLRGLANDIYCQIGLVMLIGLASKNAILIVEFANQLREQKLSITKAAIEAAESRLRPILMTSLSFMLGISPMVYAKGAGAGSRQSLGTAVFGGMILSTLLSLFVVPILYIVIDTAYEGVKTGFKNFKFSSFKKKHAK
jgi:HAE1 family hydrophobic/amphiphilic exporter-1